MKEKTKHAVDERKQLEEKLNRVTKEKQAQEKKLSQVKQMYYYFSQSKLLLFKKRNAYLINTKLASFCYVLNFGVLKIVQHN